MCDAVHHVLFESRGDFSELVYKQFEQNGVNGKDQFLRVMNLSQDTKAFSYLR